MGSRDQGLLFEGVAGYQHTSLADKYPRSLFLCGFASLCEVKKGKLLPPESLESRGVGEGMRRLVGFHHIQKRALGKSAAQ